MNDRAYSVLSNIFVVAALGLALFFDASKSENLVLVGVAALIATMGVYIYFKKHKYSDEYEEVRKFEEFVSVPVKGVTQEHLPAIWDIGSEEGYLYHQLCMIQATSWHFRDNLAEAMSIVPHWNRYVTLRLEDPRASEVVLDDQHILGGSEYDLARGVASVLEQIGRDLDEQTYEISITQRGRLRWHGSKRQERKRVWG